jgi:hypothetical protein
LVSAMIALAITSTTIAAWVHSQKGDIRLPA